MPHPLIVRRWPAIVLIMLAASRVHALPAAGCDDLRGTPIHAAVDWQADIKPIIDEQLGGRCTSCHAGSNAGGGLDLSDEDEDPIYRLVNHWHVVPGRPQESVLFLAVTCDAPPTSRRMPPAGDPLTRLQLELIHDWIAQGARGEPEDDPIFRRFVFRDGLETLR